MLLDRLGIDELACELYWLKPLALAVAAGAAAARLNPLEPFLDPNHILADTANEVVALRDEPFSARLLNASQRR